MVSGFKDDFLSFLNCNNLPFTQEGERCFLFREYNFQIYLVYLSDFLQDGSSNINLNLNKCSSNFNNYSSNPNKDCSNLSGNDTLYLFEDRWLYQKEFIKKRILARVGRFNSIFARKCNLVHDAQIKQNSALNGQIKSFLEQNHSYGSAKCKYRYALEYDGKIVAVATFSAPRPMPRPSDEIVAENTSLLSTPDRDSCNLTFASYEWVRYASLPDCRVVGGMGRLLKAFLKDISHLNTDFNIMTAIDAPNEKLLEKNGSFPIEIMSYSDTEWSSGGVYEALGFKFLQEKEPVSFYVNKNTGERISVNKVTRQNLLSGPQIQKEYIKICNCGSRKYLLQII